MKLATQNNIQYSITNIQFQSILGTCPDSSGWNLKL